MEYVHCEVSEGPRDGFKSIGIESVEGYSEYLSVEDRFLIHNGHDWFLPIATVGSDKQHGTVLVELPFEADSGAKRVWVHQEAIVSNPHEVLA